MDLAARPTITAGVALASAAVIAAGPMTQHLPKFDVAHHLPQVSVADIDLTDAAGSMMDLFSGVENELATLASGGASAAAVPASALTDFVNPATLPLPAQTWVNLLQNAGTNLQYIYNTWSQTPFPVLQQVAANWLYYGTEYVGPYHLAANGAVNFFIGNGTGSLTHYFTTAWSDYLAGNITDMFAQLYQASWSGPLTTLGLPLESVLNIPGQIMQNLTNATNYVLGSGLAGLGTSGFLAFPQTAEKAFAGSLQAAATAWGTGDPVGALMNLADVPGETVNGLLNGIAANKLTPPTNGLLSSPAFTFHNLKGNGLLNFLVTGFGPSLSKAIATPGAQNIATGGSLAIAYQTFENTLVNGWPGITVPLANFGANLTKLLQGVPSFLSTLPSIFSNAAGVLASNIGLLISNLLKLL